MWEDNEKVVGVVQYELQLGEAFFQVHPSFIHLKPEMLAYAEEHLTGITDQEKSFLKVYVNEFDTVFEKMLQSRDYSKQKDFHRPMSQFHVPELFPVICLPNGFRIKSLAEDNDLAKIDRVLWRGFNHLGDPPASWMKDRFKMQSGPHFRHDLAIVVEAPNGDFVAFSGLWFDHINKIGYVEPVATDPDYRRMGLGAAAVLEGIRRCGKLGATVAYVGSDIPFYLVLGFKKLNTQNCWIRYF